MQANAGFKRAAGLFVLCLGACKARSASQELVEPASKRGYRVIEREGHDAKQPAAVLFALHAHATPSETLPDAFSLSKAATEQNFLVVIPRGTNDADGNGFWNASRACCGNTQAEVDDLGYLHGVFVDLKRHYAVDEARVYALGVSNGAFMAHRWACSSSDLTGIAAISGVGPGPDDPPCLPKRPVRVLQIHGDRDEIVLYGGGQGVKGRYPSAYESTKRWADLNGCRTQRAPEREFFVLHGQTRREKWCDREASVLLWTFEGGEHYLKSARYLRSEVIDFLDARP